MLLIIFSFLLVHDWYDFECCRKDHCKQVPREDLEQLKDGCWRYRGNGMIFCGKKVHPSKDDGWHVCYTTPYPAYTIKPQPLCVYIQIES